MLDPRTGISFQGIDQHRTTFLSSGLTINNAPTGGYPNNLGSAVTLVSNQTVGLGSAGNRLIGIVDKFERDNKVTVRDRGYVTFNYTGAIPLVGDSVEVNGTGGVRRATSDNVDRDNVVVSADAATATCVVYIK